MEHPQKLVDFSHEDYGKWYVVNDGVMGGLSQSNIRRTDRGTGIFSGALSLENNGGFASVRVLMGRRDLSTYSGLEARVKGDGRSYQLRLRTDDEYDGIAYSARFTTADGEWTTLRIPFTEFHPTFRGRKLTNVPSLDPSRIAQLAFMLADDRPGAFSLEIEVVMTWRDDGSTQ